MVMGAVSRSGEAKKTALSGWYYFSKGKEKFAKMKTVEKAILEKWCIMCKGPTVSKGPWLWSR